MKKLIAAILFAAFAAAQVWAGPVTNKEILQLLGAGMGEEVILQVISSSETKFDTSPEALIALKNAGATDPVLAAIVGKAAPKKKQESAPPVSPFGAAPSSGDESTDGVLMIDGETSTKMGYVTPQHRSAVRGLGFGGAGAYWVLPGPKAKVRVTGKTPLICFNLFKDAQPDGTAQLTVWAVRKNNNREIMTANSSGGFGASTTLGFPPERLVSVEIVKSDKQPDPMTSMVRYEMRPKSPLAPGEYAFVMNYQVYDFGVD